MEERLIMIFDDEFVPNLPNEPLQAAKRISSAFKTMNTGKDARDRYQAHLAAYSVLKGFCEATNRETFSVDLGDDIDDNIMWIQAAFRQFDKMIMNMEAENIKQRLSGKFGTAFYEFTKGDLKRIQTLINELRELISENNDFEEDHKHRLLKRLEKLQRELYKSVADLDRFYGLIGEAGVAIGKFGKDAKPFVDRIREIAEIVWRTQAIAEELPSGMQLPLLREGDDES